MFINKLWKSAENRLPYCFAIVDCLLFIYTIFFPRISFLRIPQDAVNSL